MFSFSRYIFLSLICVLPVSVSAQAPSKDETTNAITEILHLIARCQTDGTTILGADVDFKRLDNDNEVWLTSRQRNKEQHFDGTKELFIDISDSLRDPEIAETGDRKGYKLTFQCNSTSCISPGHYTRGSMLFCAEEGSEPRRIVDRLVKALGHLWDLTPRKKPLPY
jgi:hypothetical protein